MQKNYNVGIYCRLSRDDNNGSVESMSIANQRQILIDYVKSKGWNLGEIYIDDGFSGTNFDRPDFKRLICDIEATKINCVITKDLSRLGRNYSMTGYYTDDYFPEHGVRYIAINDSVDTEEQENDFAAFHNVINEFYPRDISKKVRQVKRANAEKGMFMGSHAPYGYIKSPTDKHKLIVDVNAAPIVRRIFESIVKENNIRVLANQLNLEQIPCPRAYRYQCLGHENPKKETSLWTCGTITGIIQNEAYLGHMVQGKRKKLSFKSKVRRLTNPEEWIVVRNTHEAIIPLDLWEAVHAARAKPISYRTPKRKREISTFAGLVRCMDCGSNMAASYRGKKGAEKMTYRCGAYTNKGKSVCTSHNVREEILDMIVLNDIKSFANLAVKDRESLIKKVSSAIKSSKKDDAYSVNRQLTCIYSKLEQIQITVKNLYQDKLSGTIPESFFSSLMNDYEKEKMELEQKIPVLEEQAKKELINSDNIDSFVDKISKYIDLERIDRHIAKELIDYISVSAFYKSDGITTQDIVIYYKFVGDLSNLLKKKENIA